MILKSISLQMCNNMKIMVRSNDSDEQVKKFHDKIINDL